MIRPPNQQIQEVFTSLQAQVHGQVLLSYLASERTHLVSSLVRATDVHTLHRLQGALMLLDDLVATLTPKAP